MEGEYQFYKNWLYAVNMIKKLYIKYKEIINYLIAGFLTLIVSISSYALLTKILHIHYIISNIVSWIIAVLFAYYVNRKFVFGSTSTKKEKTKEIINFFKYRILSLIIETILIYLLVDIISINDLVSKVIVQIIVIILNYVFSKFLIFK